MTAAAGGVQGITGSQYGRKLLPPRLSKGMLPGCATISATYDISGSGASQKTVRPDAATD